MIWNLIQKKNALMQIVLCKKKDKDYDRLILKFSNIIKIRRKLINGKETVLLVLPVSFKIPWIPWNFSNIRMMGRPIPFERSMDPELEARKKF